MAIKITGNTIISDTRELQNITAADVGTQTVINDAIAFQNNVLTIYDSNNTVVRTLYCGIAATP
jgi:hypothetical protein